MQYVRCNLCGGDRYRVLFAAGVAQPNGVVRCLGCGLMYGNPRVERIDEVRFAEHDPAFLTELLARERDPRIEKERFQVIDYADTRAALAAMFPHRGRLLEVGSSYGFLCEYFRQDGWRVSGLDCDPLTSRHADEVLGVPVFRGTLSQARLPDGSHDVVLMMHVIEHVPDPVDTLGEVIRILRPGGVLVLETPRFDSLMFHLLGRRERSIACDGHIYFFTTKTLGAMVRKAGFELLRLDIVGRSLSLERLAWNLGVMSKSRRIQAAARRLSSHPWMRDRRIRLNARDMQRLVLRKPPDVAR